MDSEIKWAAIALAVFFGALFGILGLDSYLAHQRDMACIQQGGTPANKTCLFGAKGRPS